MFNLIRIKKEYKQKAIFILPLGLQEYIVILFSLTNTLIIYQYQNNKILYLYLEKFAIYYLDNILIYFLTVKSYIKYIRLIIKALAKVNLRLKLSKYKFKVIKAKFLSYIIRFR